jgi:hypothetical protein
LPLSLTSYLLVAPYEDDRSPALSRSEGSSYFFRFFLTFQPSVATAPALPPWSVA